MHTILIISKWHLDKLLTKLFSHVITEKSSLMLNHCIMTAYSVQVQTEQGQVALQCFFFLIFVKTHKKSIFQWTFTPICLHLIVVLLHHKHYTCTPYLISTNPDYVLFSKACKTTVTLIIRTGKFIPPLLYFL